MRSGVLLSLAAALLLCPTADARPPHILYLVIDDVGWTDVSYHNGTEYGTPNIDSLVRSGLELDQYYVQPVCSPTRSSLMTGLYPFHTGLQHYTTIVPGSNASLPRSAPTVAELLRGAGYSTHSIGKWHLGAARWGDTPTGRGFDSFVGYYNGQVDYYNKTIFNGFDFRQNRTVYAVANGSWSLHQYWQEMERVVAVHQANPQQPLFVYMAHQVAHIPLDLPDDPKYAARCAFITDPWRRVYCAMMQSLDDAIGDTVALWQRAGLWDDTLVVLTTDNGGMPPFQSDWPASAGCNYPLRAGKGTLFEGGVRGVAAVTGGRNVLPAALAGTRSQALMHAVDWLPTVLGRAGVTPPRQLDGHDFWPHWTGAAPAPRSDVPLNINFGGATFTALRSGDWKVIYGAHTELYDGWFPLPPAPRQPPPAHVGLVYLFNLADDPNERNDLHLQRPDKVQELRHLLDQYIAGGYVPPQENVELPQCDYTVLGGAWGPCLPDP